MSSTSDHADLMLYDDYCARIYDDRRMPPGTRELALAMAWVLLRDPLYRRRDKTADNRNALWSRVETILRRPWNQHHDDLAYRDLLREDAPRYEEPYRAYSGRCVAPMIRRSGECGQSATLRAIEFDPVTGWVKRVWWYCRRHKPVADQMKRQLARVKRPEPIPNRGGLLPCYFRGDWAGLYSWASTGWKPPYHGIVANDWPNPDDTESVPRRPRLLVLPGGAQNTDP